jgi:polar amino acid transport system substrate-binding protein
MASLGILVSGVAHEINNPNNYIMLNSELLGRAWGDVDHILEEYHETHGDFDVAGIPYEEVKEQIGQLAGGITAGAKRIENIIAVLRDFSRQESGEHTSKVAVNDVIKAALVIINNLIVKSTNQFTVTYGEQMPPVNGNFQRLEQVIINLLTNACQSLPSKDRAIAVRTYHDPIQQKNIIEIADEGIGIPESVLPHILDPFYTTKRDDGGTGLGLSISYSIIKEHNGEITFVSKADHGTTATVSIPSLALADMGT